MIAYNRIVTYSKAFGIILMVIGHCAYNIPYCRQIIYMFHMPLFFFLSGFCFKRQYLKTSHLFITKRIKGLYIPFIKWSLLFLLFHNLFFYFSIYSQQLSSAWWSQHPYTYKEFISHAISIIISMHGQDILLGGYWFLHALFWGSIIGWSLLKITRIPEYSTIIAVIICIYMNHFHLKVPVIGITPQTISATILFLVGYIFAYRSVNPFRLYQICPCILCMIIGSFFYRSDMDQPFYSTFKLIPFLITSIFTIWSFMSIFHIIHLNDVTDKIITHIGNNTLTILTFHFLAFKLVSLIIIWVYNLPTYRLAEFPVIYNYADILWVIMYTFVGLLCPLLINRINIKIMICFSERYTIHKKTNHK